MFRWGQSTPPPSIPHGMCVWGEGGLKGPVSVPSLHAQVPFHARPLRVSTLHGGRASVRSHRQDGTEAEAQRSVFSQQVPPREPGLGLVLDKQFPMLISH